MSETEFQALQNKRKPKPKEAKAQAPSKIEEQFAAQIAEAGLPEPQREYPHIRGRMYRLDFAWPDMNPPIACEVQGQVHRIKSRYEADITKRALSQLAGWTVLEVSGKAIRDGRAIEWLKQLLEGK